MEERLLHLLESEHLSSSKFADVIGVQRSSVSHILSGRNKPSFDFMQKTLKAFPALNADWLILGEGDMYEGTVSSASDTLLEKGDQEALSGRGDDQLTITTDSVSSAENVENPANISLQDRYKADKEQSQELRNNENNKRISRVILFYDDNSFDTYDPHA